MKIGSIVKTYYISIIDAYLSVWVQQKEVLFLHTKSYQILNVLDFSQMCRPQQLTSSSVSVPFLIQNLCVGWDRRGGIVPWMLAFGKQRFPSRPGIFLFFFFSLIDTALSIVNKRGLKLLPVFCDCEASWSLSGGGQILYIFCIKTMHKQSNLT